METNTARPAGFAPAYRHPDTIRTLEIPAMSMADLVEHRRRALAAAEPAPAPTCDECGAPLAEWEETTCRDCDGGGADQECVGSVVTLDDGSSRFMVRR